VGRKKKLHHFVENETFDNLFQFSFEQIQAESFSLKGKWHAGFFKNQHPIVLELGCGKGEYTIGLARTNPDKNFIGMDVKGARLWRGLKTASEESITNVAFIRSRIELIENYFGPNEISEIWITFPDPQPRQARERKRLTSPKFLEIYRKFLSKDGIIHLKTDSDLLFEFTSEMIKNEQHNTLFSTNDLYATEQEMEVKNIRTFYEQRWLNEGLTIKYVAFRLNEA
jgi:tRNA (guanine-N7-)-methyltransferase